MQAVVRILECAPNGERLALHRDLFAQLGFELWR
jgi:hypothetical protein